MWDELSMYHPHTTNAKILLKRAEEGKIFSLLRSLRPEYENLWSHILMSSMLPTFSSVRARRNLKKSMNSKIKNIPESSTLTVKRDEKGKHFKTEKMRSSKM